MFIIYFNVMPVMSTGYDVIHILVQLWADKNLTEIFYAWLLFNMLYIVINL